MARSFRNSQEARPPVEEQLEAVAQLLAHARSVLFITGAGLSADSGLPTYRGVGGLYNDQTADEGMAIEDILSGVTMATRPELVWRHLRQVEEVGRHARPNRGHHVIAAIEQTLPRVWVLTQNVDGFHRSAGSRNVIDMHGDLHNLICPLCGWHETVENYAELNAVPHCPSCGGVVRPDVVLFGELLDTHKVHVLTRELRVGFDVTFSVGTSSLFPYITLPVERAMEEHRATVEINPGETDLSGLVRYQLPLGAAEALELIWSRAQVLLAARKN